MKKAVLAIVLLPLLLLSTQAFGQSASSIGGSVMDTSQAVLPGSSCYGNEHANRYCSEDSRQ